MNYEKLRQSYRIILRQGPDSHRRGSERVRSYHQTLTALKGIDSEEELLEFKKFGVGIFARDLVEESGMTHHSNGVVQSSLEAESEPEMTKEELDAAIAYQMQAQNKLIARLRILGQPLPPGLKTYAGHHSTEIAEVYEDVRKEMEEEKKQA